ncbi:unnamed protein product [Sphenostylis stenocarpa]|uniref:Uncharacterized protein n=1 Tax=Sphenostylis stenocarpa TaxID=92480 RepID=A0AA86RU37_9FABA|nr:unnamed protein product [Sphenostylis stenocarpa]
MAAYGVGSRRSKAAASGQRRQPVTTLKSRNTKKTSGQTFNSVVIETNRARLIHSDTNLPQLNNK